MPERNILGLSDEQLEIMRERVGPNMIYYDCIEAIGQICRKLNGVKSKEEIMKIIGDLHDDNPKIKLKNLMEYLDINGDKK
jgi:hypothetical protein